MINPQQQAQKSSPEAYLCKRQVIHVGKQQNNNDVLRHIKIEMALLGVIYQILISLDPRSQSCSHKIIQISIKHTLSI